MKKFGRIKLNWTKP